ncbi:MULTISPECIES: nucleotide pyrophosphohydrolase [Paraburkholderia]|uniref:NTP pyrophosphatase (Non-canonical NTP hydrolase) n=1 Tax=Paraburkholderia tropica TaxID=92647 RepID=A0A1A5X4U5_9BURK|nr:MULTISPECIES: nucleotide pyrophosphohydrolase [Paraburkholderia]MBB2980784.1 NTP pyrophosphatase (non-canonical NTP hydrolase) [Paraburkholderia tropica]MBB3002268.1 NTP pyrophosphatase (non-canonical NTP hydrolase) [Paraburkholderia tropica]MBB6321656.1 NTP pyrophosphatase (non-canonical NTP hydrolase) [Paraburkholderia tropica]MDE1140166.1 nucleotide pyrophosphohydrolase [Paraburkholderia tropica]OBR48140.1 nucleotide pyrophosphohydrolase [Paraburkholderia tropica]
MNDSTSTPLDALIKQVLAFREARDWQQFHTLRNLIVSTSIEAGELLETIQWKDDAQIAAMLADPAARAHLEQECADVFIYLLLTAHTAGFDLVKAAADKVRVNETRYPVEKAKGNAKKHSDL